MSNILSLLLLLAFLFAGMLLGRIKAVAASKITGYLLDTALYFLLFFMGFRLGRNEEIAKRLTDIGILSVAFTAATVIGTILVLLLIYMVTGRAGSTSEKEQNSLPLQFRFIAHMKEPGKLFLVVVIGFLLGKFVGLFPAFTAEHLTTYILYCLLLVIGIQLNKNSINLKEVLLHPETILLPLGTIAGSLAGGAVVGLIFGIPQGRALAVASGFGWYSLSGVLITDLGDQVLGSAAFISNILRESVALLTIPVFGATRFPRIGIGVAGATSMDVSLPLIQRSCGTSAVPLAVTNGAILSLFVPILVPLFYHAGA